MYTELKVKSNFSFLRGASDSREYIERALELCMNGIAITDLNGVYALPRAYEVQKNFPHLNLISGAELTFLDHPPLTFLAENKKGYSVLCRMITRAHQGKEKGHANLTVLELLQFAEEEGFQNLMVLPDVRYLATAPHEQPNFPLLKSLFKERLYLPISKYLDGLDDQRVKIAHVLAKTYGIKLVATNDVHYHVPERRMLQDSLACVREGTTLRSAGFKLFGNDERYLKSPLQMAALFKDMPYAIKHTQEISERCRFSLSELTYSYPSELIPPGHTAQSYFEELVGIGATKIYRGLIPAKVDAQIQHEFRLIKKMNYASYFLTIHDIVAFARSRDIICQGRGSAANSISCYCLGITAIDPVRMNLLFERFISEERAEPPDIDVDFEHERREEVIQFVYNRYGRERAGMVAAVRTYQKRSAFLELSKAIGIPVGVMSAQSLERDFEKVAGADINKRPLIDAMVEDVTDFPRHLSIHSGGFTLSADPIIETVPIEPARMENRTIVQWDKNDLDSVGLLKVDILSLGFLTALHKICNMLNMDWRDIPAEDPETYDMICRAETEGTFQIESRAQRSMLTRTLPRTFYDLVVQVAIVRPGPNVGEMIHPYIKRREAARRGQKYELPDADLQSVLGRTFGVPIFQEQIMKLAILKAGFSPGEADQLRRALAAHRSAEDVQKVGKKLYEGLIKNGVSKAYAEELLGYVKGYSHYGFPESHAASFALISYKSAYLKCHYPAEFLCGLINSQPMGFYSVDTLINAFKRYGVKVLPVHPQFSNWDAKMEAPGTVRMGFRNIARMNEVHANGLIEERNKKSFTDLLDFIQRSRLPREVIELMALGDLFTCFGLDQRHTFWKSIEYQALFDKKEEQLPLFTEAQNFQPTSEKVFSEMNLLEEISADYRATGYSLRGNMMRAIRLQDLSLPKATSADLKHAHRNKLIQTCGVLMVIQRPPTANGTCFITLEDEFGSIDLVIKKEVYERNKRIIQNNRFFKIKGTVQTSGSGRSILVSELAAIIVDSLNAKPVSAGTHPRDLGKLV